LHQHPHIPEFSGQGSYPGEILHSSQYRLPVQVTSKKVLIVGAGESGADITAEIVNHASETVLSLRRGGAVVSRRALGKPRDYLTSRLINSSSHWLFQTRHPDDDRKRNIFRALFLPVVIVDKCLQLLHRVGWEYLPLFLSSGIKEVHANLKTHKLTLKLLEESGGTMNEQFATKDDDFVRAIAAGKCRRVPAISGFDGKRASFEDGSSFEPDLVLLCTGFETRIPFLDKRLESAPRYLNTFTAEGGESLGFIGFLRPAFGAIPPLAELQARWFALVQSGIRKLPSPDTMAESIDQWLYFRRHHFRASGERLGHLVDHTVFCDELATQVGCKPGLRELKRESVAFRLRFFSAPFVAAQYRLTGPNAKPALARRIIEGLPIAHPLPQLINLYLRWIMCRLLHRALGPEYATKLSIV
jgi:dimethylaniline monooxygenase (N-oxide forming)